MLALLLVFQATAQVSSAACDTAAATPPASAAERGPVPLDTNPLPEYPSLALDAGIGGRVVVAFVVGTDGRVEPGSYCIEEDFPVAPQPLHDAIRSWRFEPALQHGDPVRVRMRLRVVLAPRDTLRGPMAAPVTVAEVPQPGLQDPEPSLRIGPRSLTHGREVVDSAAPVGDDLRDALYDAALRRAPIREVTHLCAEQTDGTWLPRAFGPIDAAPVVACDPRGRRTPDTGGVLSLLGPPTLFEGGALRASVQFANWKVCAGHAGPLGGYCRLVTTRDYACEAWQPAVPPVQPLGEPNWRVVCWNGGVSLMSVIS